MRPLVIGLVGAAVWYAGAPDRALAGEIPSTLPGATATPGNAAPQPAGKAARAVPLQPGMTIHLDPQTGALLPEPAAGTVPIQVTPDLLKALSSSHDGLVEVPSPVPGGGVSVDLQGRFQSPLFAIIGPDGKVRIRHVPEAPAATETK
jgi:hypothetical protein